MFLPYSIQSIGTKRGPSARTYFNNGGFTRPQVLDLIYTFYQENMSSEEIRAAIHTDSNYGDRLRAEYHREEAVAGGRTAFKRVRLLGCRRGFEMPKRVDGDNYNNA